MNRTKIILGIFLVMLIAFAMGVQLYSITHDDFIGHSDVANNAVLARNFAEGRGFVVDYVWHYYIDYPAITHPEDEWPLLQPLIMAPFYILFGKTLFGMKLAGFLVFAALMAAVFVTGRRYFGAFAGLAAASFLVGSGLYDKSFYPFNDVGFCLFGFVSVALAAAGLERRRGGLFYLLSGVSAGLAYLAKPYASMMIITVLGFLAYEIVKKRISISAFFLYLVPCALVISPYLIRNYLLFADPFFSCARFQAATVEYLPWEEMSRVWFPHPPVYFASMAEYGALIVVKKWIYQVAYFAKGLSAGEYVDPLVFMAALFGWRSFKGNSRLIGMALLWFLASFLFIVVYWHYEGRYFYFLIPFVTLAAGNFVSRAFDPSEGVERKTRYAARLAALILVVFGLFAPFSFKAESKLQEASEISPYTVMFEWIKENIPPDEVIMSTDNRELNYHSLRKNVMIPYDGRESFDRIASKYGVRYIQLSPMGKREYLGPLYKGIPVEGFRKLYGDDENELYVYEIERMPSAVRKDDGKIITVVLRYDDVSSRSSPVFTKRVIDAFTARDLKCSLGIIPFACTGDLHEAAMEEVCPIAGEMADIVRSAVKEGTSDAALHGYSHKTVRGDMDGGYSEFYGIEFETQRKKISAGRAFLEKTLGTRVATFVPPWNSYDRNTVRVLEDLGFDCLAAVPGKGQGDSSTLKYLPATCTIREVDRAVQAARRIGDARPVIPVWFHEVNFIEMRKDKRSIGFGDLESVLDRLGAAKDVEVDTISGVIGKDLDLGYARLERYTAYCDSFALLPDFMRPDERFVYFVPGEKCGRDIAVWKAVTAAFYLIIFIISFSAGFWARTLVIARSGILLFLCRYAGFAAVLVVMAYALRDGRLEMYGALIITVISGTWMGTQIGGRWRRTA